MIANSHPLLSNYLKHYLAWVYDSCNPYDDSMKNIPGWIIVSVKPDRSLDWITLPVVQTPTDDQPTHPFHTIHTALFGPAGSLLSINIEAWSVLVEEGVSLILYSLSDIPPSTPIWLIPQKLMDRFLLLLEL